MNDVQNVPPGYKQTEVGVIPEDWDVKALNEISEKIMVGIASSATHAYQRRGIPLLRNQNIKPGFLDDSDVLYVNEAYEATFKNKRLQKGDLITARTGYPGTTCVVPARFEGAQSFTTLITRPNHAEVDSFFLSFYINSSQGREFFEQNQIGGGQKNVNAGALKTMLVAVPPLPEQKAIASALRDMDDLLDSQRAFIAKKRDLKTAALDELLSPKRRLPGFSGEWEEKTLGDVVQIRKGTLITEKLVVLGSVPVIAGGKQPAYFHNRANRTGKTITISASGASAGFVAFHKEPIFASDCSTISEAEDYCLEFLYFILLLHQDDIYGTQTGGAQPHVHSKDLNPFEIQLPPTLAEQQAIAQVLGDMDDEIAALEEEHRKTRSLKSAMMDELLTGRTRLR